MRPRKLRIEGFTCFREPAEIDFSGLDVFVISGPNGAGKTTIVDAICYALYGQVSRQTKVPDLIARGASAMRVQLEFEAGGERYRVHRGVNLTRSTNKKTGAEKVTRDISPVQFEMYRNGQWDPRANRVAEIDRAIVEAVGLDFESFTRCVLLPQGRFAEFLAGDRAQRRALLIELLDIGIYEKVMRAANVRAAALNTQIGERERQLRDDYAGATDEALAVTQEQIVLTKPSLETARGRRTALQEACTHATTAAAAYRSERERREQHETKLREVAGAGQLASTGEAQLKGLTSLLVDAQAALKASPFDTERHTALRIARDAVTRVEQLRSEAARAKAAAAKLDVTAARKNADEVESKLVAARQAAGLAEEALRAAERSEVAAHVRSGLKPGDVCPVCGETVRKIAKGAASTLAPAQKTERDAKSAQAKAADAASKAANELTRVTQQAKSAAETVEKTAADLRREEDALRSVLPQGVSATVEAASAAFDEQEKARVERDVLASAFEMARKRRDEHERAMIQSKQLIAELTAQAKQLEGLIEQDMQARKQAAALVKEIAARWQWPDVNELIEASKSPAVLLKEMLDAAQHESDDLTRNIATLEADEKRIANAIERAAKLRDEMTEMKESWQLCRDLGTLLRADNFQEFVIVEAMQLLAVTASEHLKTLYDRFAIAVDGSEFTVIDHWQAAQVRSAKTLSGGETFVASLALALALSERLPELRNAAASSLESLFLDEGFGTLDFETLDAVIDALEGLRSEGRMVGIITHVPELAQRVEHRIVVRKSPEGSSVAMATA